MNLADITTSDIGLLKIILEEYGVGILENHFDDGYADEVFNSVKNWLIGLDIGLTDNVTTWSYKNVPLGPRFGMYQSIISNAPKFWELREKISQIFQQILGEEELITSVDGASFIPTLKAPNNKKDWAHIDQTSSSDFRCYQSQFVAADTDATFVCTPKSHLVHSDILQTCGIKKDDDWYKFTNDDVIKLKNIFTNSYQIPIPAKKGSIIFWDSRTIHSAKYPNFPENNWRAVFYISMRPKSIFGDDNIKNIQNAVINGKTTNHWGTKIFNPLDRFKLKNPLILNLVANSQSLSYYPLMNDKQKQLCGF